MICCPTCDKNNEGSYTNLNFNEVAICPFCGTGYAEETMYDTDFGNDEDYYYGPNSYEIIVRTFEDNLAISTNFNMKRKKYFEGL